MVPQHVRGWWAVKYPAGDDGRQSRVRSCVDGARCFTYQLVSNWVVTSSLALLIEMCLRLPVRRRTVHVRVQERYAVVRCIADQALIRRKSYAKRYSADVELMRMVSLYKRLAVTWSIYPLDLSGCMNL